MLYMVGLGLDKEGISQQGLEIIKKCEKVYLENYTVDFPYSKTELEKILGKKIINADRNKVEGLSLVDEAEGMDIALLIYGSPLTATTHITLMQEAKRQKVKCELIYNASVFDAVAETGLQLYKFGKITSIPNFEANSFIEIVKENQKINAHSLILVDIGLGFEEALERLENAAKKNKVKIEKLAICSMLGTTKSKIYYNSSGNLKNKEIKSPFCIIIPGKLHFLEEEILENFNS